MNQEILKQPIFVTKDATATDAGVWKSYFPAIFSIVGAVLFVMIRIYGGRDFMSDGGLMMLALGSYLLAACFYLTNLYAPSSIAEKLGLWGATLGVFFNLASWLFRWVFMYEREVAIFLNQGRELSEMPWLFRYVPFSNLYDMSLTFAFGAGITTLLVMRRPHFRAVATIALPLAAIILTLARFIGGEVMDLPPVLDSYWRPIHVGVAALSYGIALVCFVAAVLYLLKDGLKVETMAIWTSAFALMVFASISKFSVFSPGSFGSYTASTFLGNSRMSLALRAELPYVGWLIVASGALLAGVMFLYSMYISKGDEKARKIGLRLLQAALVVQGAAIGMLVYQIKSITNVVGQISSSQYEKFAVWMLQQEQVPQAQIAAMGPQQLSSMASQWIQQNGSKLQLSLNANPVELAALITAFAGTFFILMFSFRTDRLRAALPSAETLDGLMYKLAGITFAGLALLLITGAVWANESWGRYWGWDAKEVGALVAWITYAGFLHARIARGWTGRRSAYFAVVAFLFIVFTYLGVSYLLPGLHSYA